MIRSLSILAALLGCAVARAADVPISSEPGNETNPVVSADGRWLVYVTDRDGNRALEALDLRSANAMPVRIAGHPADSDSPVLSPDGRWLAFRSTREDALGDIFVMRFPDGTPRNLTSRGIEDRSPRWMNANTIAFERETAPASGTWTWAVVTQEGRETNSTYLPPTSPLPFPVVAQTPDAQWVLLATEDRNGDGVLSGLDGATLWRMGRGPYGLSPVLPGRVFHDPRGIAALSDGRLLISLRTVSDHDLLAIFPVADGETQDPRAAARATYINEGTTDSGIEWLRREIDGGRIGGARVALQLVTERIQSTSPQAVAADQLLTPELRLQADRLALLELVADPFASPAAWEALQLRLMHHAAAAQESGSALEAQAQMALAESMLRSPAPRPTTAATALRRAVEVATNNNAAVDPHALLLLGDALLAANLRDEARQTWARLLQDPAQRPIAITRIMDSMERDDDPRSRQRAFLSTVESDRAIGAAVELDLARRLLGDGDEPYAEETLRNAESGRSEGIRASYDAALELARLYTRQGRASDALATFQDLLVDAGTPSTIADIARGQTARILAAEGRMQLRLGDPMLASRTFEDLIAVNPGNVEGWRGRFSANAGNTGRMRIFAAEALADARRDESDALAWYRHGLAESYLDPASRKALRSLERAARLDPAQPYYHQTMGFVLERQGSGNDRSDLLERAAEAYGRALRLTDPAENAIGYADLLLNSGNIAMELDRSGAASTFYIRRGQLAVPFENQLQRLLYHRNAGIALFRSLDPNRAEVEFAGGLAILREPSPELQKLLPEEQRREFRREFVDRRALALAEANRLAEAVAEYRVLLGLVPANTLDEVRAHRNSGLVRMRLAATEGDSAARRLLIAAREDLVAAMEILEGRRNRGSGLSLNPLNISMGMSSAAETGGANINLSVRDERRLITAALAQVERLLGNTDEFARRAAEVLEQEPSLTEESRAYYLTQRAALHASIASEELARGNHDAAAEQLLRALESTSFTVKDVPLQNLAAATWILSRLGDLALLQPDAVPREDLARAWPLPAPPRKGPPIQGTLAELLERCASSLLSAEVTGIMGSAPLLVEPQQRIRMELLRARLLENLAFSALATEPELSGGMRAGACLARADAAMRRAITLAPLTLDLTETNRLLLLAHGQRIRAAAYGGDAATLETLRRDALTFARATGQEGFAWWLFAQEALFTADAEARARAAEEAATQLESLAPGALPRGVAVPWAVLDAVESAALSPLAEAEDWDALWLATDRWRGIRLRTAFAWATAPARDEAETEWLTQFRALRDDYRRQLDRMQRTVAERSTPAAQAEAARLATAIRAHITGGAERGVGAAALLTNANYGLADAQLIASADSPMPTSVLLVLSRDLPGLRVRVGITDDAAFPMDDKTAAAMAADRPLWFVLGEELASVPEGVTAVQVLTTEAMLLGAENVALEMPSPPVRVGDGAAVNPDVLAAAYDLRLDTTLRSSGDDPFRWSASSDGSPLGDVLQPLESTRRFSITRPMAEDPGTPTRRARSLALAGALAHSGVQEAEFANATGTQRWLGLSFSPEDMPERALDELDAERGVALEALRASDPARAVPALQTVLALKTALNDEENLVMFEQLLAQSLGDLGRFEEAMSASARSVAILYPAGDSNDLRDALSRLGSDASRSRQYPQSFAAYRQAAEMADRLGDTHAAVEARINLGVAYENAGLYREAFEVFEAVRNTAESAGDHLLVAEQWRRLARIQLLRLGQYDAAVDSAGQARDRAASIARDPGSDDDLRQRARRLQREAELDIVRARIRQGFFDDAQARAEEVDAVARRAGDRLLMGQALLEIANVRWYRADYFESLRAQREALQVALDEKDPALEIAVRNAIGLTHWTLNDHDESLRALGEALELAQGERIDSEVASTHNNIGVVRRSRAEYQEALREFEAALAIDRRLANAWGIGYDLRNTGMTLLAMGDAAGAEPLLVEAIAVSSEIGDRTNEAKTRLALGDVLAATARPADAAASYRSALEAALTVPLPEVAWRAEYGLAMLAENGGNRPEATTLLAAAIDRIEALRAAIRIEEFQDGFLSDKQDVYDSMVRLLMEDNRPDAAFEFSERARGRNFIDLLGNTKIELANPGDDDLLRRETELRARLEELERRASQSHASTVATELADARRAYSEFLIELRLANPQLSAFVRVEPVTVGEVRSLLDAETRLVSYHVMADRVVLWVIGRDGLGSAMVPVRREELAARIEGLRSRLQEFQPVDAELRILGQQLIAPALPLLGNATRIGVIPHRELHSMPFAALRTGRGDESLVDRVAIFHAPSASVLRYTFERRRAFTVEGARILAIGNPDLGSSSLNLPFAQKEAERLVLEFPGATLVTNKDATESWISENIGDFAIVHIASHGEYDPGNPLFSSIRLTSDSKNDGVLTAAEVFSLAMRADLVALSACQTGLGRLSSGDDIVGLNRAFVYAGTRQLLSSLWRVDDVSTSVLIKHFYRNVREENRAEALRQAQLRVRERYPHPAHWAGLVLTGDWQ